ncbi:MAG: O-antigen ligase family protein [Lachnospiraceae bacterium]|nr:O-antigen ligase family protein [Lachnospiraceae bacterium]
MKYQRKGKSITSVGRESKRYEKIFVAVAMVFFTVFPFIARVSVMKVTSEEEAYFITQNGYISDIALYSKEIAVVAFAAIAILFFIGERIFTDHPEPFDREAFKRLKVPLILIGVMTFFSTLSMIFASNGEVAFRGVFTEFEGLLAILSYILIFLFGMYYLRKEDCIEFFKHFVVAVSFIAGVLCCVELFVKPILEFRFVQHLISPEKYIELAESIESKYFAGQSALMFNNPGFLGSFAALFLPIDIALVAEAKRRPVKSIRIIASALMCVALYGSASKASWIAVVISVAVMALFVVLKWIHTDIIRIVHVTLTLVICVAAFALSSVLVAAKTEGIETYESGPAAVSDDIYRLDRATLTNGVLEFASGDDTLVCSVDFDKFDEYMIGEHSDSSFVDCIVFSDGERVLTEREDSFYENARLGMFLVGTTPVDERFDMITVATEGQMVYFCFGYDGPAQFAMTADGFKSFAQGDILEDAIPQPAVTGFESIYGFGTGRGYIWVQSLPVMAGSLFIGKGCGNFPFYFIQNEIVGLLNTHGSMKYVIDRPHNWYIQSFVSNGLPYLICMLVLFAGVLIKGGKLGLRKKLGIFDIGLLAGVTAFMIAGLINDSCITVNPLFWLVLGVTVRRIYCNPEFGKKQA